MDTSSAEWTVSHPLTGGDALFEPGDIVGLYRLLRRLGAGATGVVFEAEHLTLHERVAVKFFMLQGDTPEAREAEMAQCVAAARTIAQLQYPGIVGIKTLEIDAKTGALYLVMEYIAMSKARRKALMLSALGSARAWRQAPPLEAPEEPLTLEALIRVANRHRRRINPALVRQLLMAICKALHAAHISGRGLLHRNLKPSNILIRPDGQPVIVDFGLTVPEASTPDSLASHTAAQTLSAVAAPELRKGEKHTALTDLYALGMLAYQLLSGEPELHASAQGGKRALSALWHELLALCLHDTPQMRYPDVEHFRQALEALPKRRFRQGLLAVGCVTLVGLIGVALMVHSVAEKRLLERPITYPEYRHGIHPAEIREGQLVALHPDAYGELHVPTLPQRFADDFKDTCTHPVTFVAQHERVTLAVLRDRWQRERHQREEAARTAAQAAEQERHAKVEAERAIKEREIARLMQEREKRAKEASALAAAESARRAAEAEAEAKRIAQEKAAAEAKAKSLAGDSPIIAENPLDDLIADGKGKFHYRINGNGDYTLCKVDYRKTGLTITIPAYASDGITAITHIGAGAFRELPYNAKVVFLGSVEIEPGAFPDAAPREIVFADDCYPLFYVTSFSRGKVPTFYERKSRNATRKINLLDTDDGVTYLRTADGCWVFSVRSNVSHIRIPAKYNGAPVRGVLKEAFCNLRQLRQITFQYTPYDVRLDETAFRNCPAVEKISGTIDAWRNDATLVNRLRQATGSSKLQLNRYTLK